MFEAWKTTESQSDSPAEKSHCRGLLREDGLLTPLGRL